MSIHSTWAKTKLVTRLQYWTHYCFYYDNGKEEWKIYENGALKGEGILPKYDGPLDGGGAYIIGKKSING